MIISNVGYSGIYIIGFSHQMAPVSYMSNYISNIMYYDYDNEYNESAEVVQSVVTSDGEACAGQDEVMVGVDYDPPADEGKSYQRVLCAALQSPTSLNATCQKVLMGEEPRPNLNVVDTSSWYNWLACPDQYLIVKIYWVYNSSLSGTPYEYTAADCCITVNSEYYYYYYE
ncbi:hypothetical protein Pmani_006371 [Petrolisthes manimaculis]|uniref:Uncharacterized protein n=1 Tax=Petrolisthes manimaculis TaxID=1843537 RepID=A0AAE1QCQ9_9EUCA|nr:hypothetical protein Pmani_006371 [Petrolisthes manimaculis]